MNDNDKLLMKIIMGDDIKFKDPNDTISKVLFLKLQTSLRLKDT